MPASDHRTRRQARMADQDRQLIADTRSAIERSLLILRESMPEACLGKNYCKRTNAPEPEDLSAG